MLYISGFGGTILYDLILSICLQDCYIRMAIRSAAGGGGGNKDFDVRG